VNTLGLNMNADPVWLQINY